MRHRAHGIIVGAQILRALAPRTLNFGNANGRLQRARHLFGYAILKIKNIIHRTVMTSGPYVSAALGFDKLHDNPDADAGLLHAAFEHIGDAQFPADVTHIHCPTLVGKRRVSRDHKKRADARQRPGDRFDDPFTQILLARLTAHIVEG